MDQPWLPVKQAFALVPCGVTKGYALLGEGTLEGIKLGRKTLISRASIERLHDSLPKLDTPTLRRNRLTVEPDEANAGIAHEEEATAPSSLAAVKRQLAQLQAQVAALEAGTAPP